MEEVNSLFQAQNRQDDIQLLPSSKVVNLRVLFSTRYLARRKTTIRGLITVM